MAAVVATAVNADGHREILGLDVLTSEDGAGWTAFLRDLVVRGLQGIRRRPHLTDRFYRATPTGLCCLPRSRSTCTGGSCPRETW